MTCDEPQTDLDRHLDDLVRALGRTPTEQLVAWRDTMSSLKSAYLASLGTDATAEQLGAADFWEAMANIAGDVIALQEVN